MVLAVPAYALVPQSIYYDFSAAGNEPALRIVWTGHPDTIVTGDEFRLQTPQESTLAEVEARIQAQVDDLLLEDVKWNQLDQEEEPYLSGVLSPGEEIVYVGPQQYLRTWKAWFAIHIYSLDNLSTPESELRFVTRIYKRSVFPGGTSWADIYPGGWWPSLVGE